MGRIVGLIVSDEKAKAVEKPTAQPKIKAQETDKKETVKTSKKK
jgi:hypothetical protein